MSQDLGQSHEIVAGVGKILVSHRMAEQVRMQPDSGDRRILVAQRPDTTIRQRPTLADEDTAGLRRRTGFQVRLNCLPGRKGYWDRPLLVALGESKDGRPAAVGQYQVMEFERNEVRNPATRV